MSIKGAIIGLGFIGASGTPGKTVISHAGAYREHPKIRLVAGADPDPARREAFTRTWGVEKVFSDYRKMLDKCRPDMVGICVPTPLHHAMAREVMTSGVRLVILEKPMTENLEQADDLIALAQKNRSIVSVNYGRAWEKNTQEMVSVLKQGLFGEILAVRGTFTGGVVHNGTHMFQLVNEVLGWPLTLTASQDTSGALVGVVEYTHGRRASFTGLENLGYSLHELDFITSSGRCLYLSGGQRIERLEARDSRCFPGFKELQVTRVVQNPGLSGYLSAAISDLLEAARVGRSLRCGLVEARQALAVGLAMNESCRFEGARILLERPHAKGV